MKTKLLKRLRREADEAADDYFFVWMIMQHHRVKCMLTDDMARK